MITHRPARPSWMRYCPYQFAKFEFAWEVPIPTQCLDSSNWSNLLPSNETFTCGTCEKAFGRRDSIKMHLVICHTNALPFSKAQCSDCKKKWSRKSRLAKHMLIAHKAIHPSKPLHCKTVTWPGCWHRRICCASYYITLKCNHSGKNVSRKSMLIRHMFVVFGAKVMACRRISCVSCYISFKTSFSLMGHMESSFFFRNL